MPFRDILLAMLVCLLWGGNFVAAKLMLQHFPTFFFLAIRLMVVVVLLLPFVKKPMLSWQQLLVVSLIFTVLHFGCMFGAMRLGLDVSVAVVVDQLRVPFAVLFSVFLLNERLGWRSISGIAIAFSGTMLIVGAPNAIGNILAFIISIGAPIGWALYNVRIKQLGNIGGPLGFLTWVALFGIPPLLLLSFCFESGQMDALKTVGWKEVALIAYIGIGVNIISHGVWYYLLARYPISQVTPYSLLVPVFGMVAAIVFLNETLTWQIIFGGLATLLGVGIVTWRRPAAALEGDET